MSLWCGFAPVAEAADSNSPTGGIAGGAPSPDAPEGEAPGAGIEPRSGLGLSGFLPAASLSADRIELSQHPVRKLVAEGNVELYHDGVLLRAGRVEYVEGEDRLVVAGPISVEEEGGEISIVSDSAELARNLRTGQMRGVKVVMARQVRVAALAIDRIDGRYTRFYKSVATSCSTCENERAPLWEIRARRIVHDEATLRIRFSHAQFRVRGVPVLYIPAFSIPDPREDRSRGFLVASFADTTELGTGIRVPYFIPIGDDRDLTLEPYVAERTMTIGWRWRQAYANGDLAMNGSFSDDEIVPDRIRNYVFANGSFDMAKGWTSTVQVQAASDETYVSQYGVTDADRLVSEVAFRRIRPRDAVRVSTAGYKSLLGSFASVREPNAYFDGAYARRIPTGFPGTEAVAEFEGQVADSVSSSDGGGLGATRVSTGLALRNSRIAGPGIRHEWQVGAAADAFRYDASVPDELYGRVTPGAYWRVGLPMSRPATQGGGELLEPVVQIGWARSAGDVPPLRESRLAEFDQGNLLALSRFPAADGRETSGALAYGLNWARRGERADAWLTVARVTRTEADAGFTRSSGLSGRSSDLLLAGRVRLPNGGGIGGRALVDGGPGVTRAELRADWNRAPATLSATYGFLVADPKAGVGGLEDDVSAIRVSGAADLARRWRAEANYGYSIAESAPREARFAATYRIECVDLEFSVRRRYTSLQTQRASNSYGFNFNLAGFSRTARGQAVGSKQCKAGETR